MAHQLTCPCGEVIIDFDATFVESVNSHLADNHPGREYSEDEIMFISISLPDRLLSRKSDG